MADELYDYEGPEVNETDEWDGDDCYNEYQYFIDTIEKFLSNMKDLTIPESDGIQKCWDGIKGELGYLSESLGILGDECEDEDDWEDD